MIEHCISLFSKKQKEKAYRIYVTDCLKAIADNTTHLLGIDGVIDYGTTIPHRFVDMVYPDKEKQKKQEEFDKMSTKDIVDGIWNRAKKGGKT